MAGSIDSLPNLGPYMARSLAEIDVTDADALRALGAVEAFARLKFRFGRAMSLNALWAIDAALSGIHWRDITAERKARLKTELESRSRVPAGKL